MPWETQHFNSTNHTLAPNKSTEMEAGGTHPAGFHSPLSGICLLLPCRSRGAKWKQVTNGLHAFSDEGGKGEWQNIFSDTTFSFCPCSSANLILIAGKDHRETLFFMTKLCYILKKWIKRSATRMFCFMAFCGYYLKKKKICPLTQFKPRIWKKSHWADFASELKHDGTHPTLWWLIVKASIQAEPCSGNQQTNMCRHDSAVDLDCRIWKQRLNSTSSLMNEMVFQIPWKQKICTQWDNSFAALKGRGRESTVIILIKWMQEEYTSLWSRMWHTSPHPPSPTGTVQTENKLIRRR